MQVSPINNVSFNGQFVKTPELKNLMSVSDKKTLTVFNKIIDRMAKVDDGCKYKIICHKSRNPLSYTENLRFYMNKENTKTKSISCEQIIDKIVSTCESQQEQFEKCSNVLKQFLPTLEKEYPRVEDVESKSELMKRILDKLV